MNFEDEKRSARAARDAVKGNPRTRSRQKRLASERLFEMLRFYFTKLEEFLCLFLALLTKTKRADCFDAHHVRPSPSIRRQRGVHHRGGGGGGAR